MRLSASDGELGAADEVSVVVNELGAKIFTSETRVGSSSDDAEEKPSGTARFTSSDLELVYDGGNQTVGIRFSGLDIPTGATIESAYVQFQVDETGSGDTFLTIEGEDSGNAPPFRPYLTQRFTHLER